MQLLVETLEGATRTVNVDAAETCGDIKIRLQVIRRAQHDACPPQTAILRALKAALPALEDFLRGRSTSTQGRITTLAAEETRPIDAAPPSSEITQEMFGVPAELQRLSCNSRPLYDEVSVAGAGLAKGSTVQLNLRLPGGKPVVRGPPPPPGAPTPGRPRPGARPEGPRPAIGTPRTPSPQRVALMTGHLPCGPEVTIDADEDTPKHEMIRQLSRATGVPPEHVVLRLGGLNQLMMGDRRTNVRFNISCGTSSNIKFALPDDKGAAK